MNQLVVLQEIYASLSKGGDGLQKIDSKAIEGSCPELLSKLLESSRKGRIDEDVCRELSLKLQDVYEIKRLGDICRRAGLPDLAIITYNRALSLCRDPILRPVLQNNLGQAFVRQGDLAKASFYYQKSADCFAKEGDHTGLAHVLGNLGSAYRRSGDWNKAIEHCYRSLKTFEEKGDDLGIAQMTGSLGRIYADMGEKELAARYFERSLTDFQRLGDKRSAAWVLDRLGRIAGQRMDWDKALSCFNSSLSLFEEQGESQSQGIVLSNLGRIYLQMGQATAAREPLERAVLLISRQMNPGYQNALYCLAKTYSSLAKNCLQEDTGQPASRQQRLEASRLFIQAANGYQELSSTIGEGQAEIKVAEAIAKSQSYLVRLCGDVQGEEALILAERAQTFLDNAAANANDNNKAKILGLQRIIAGMKEVHSIGLLANEPMMLTRALNNASEYLMSGAQEWPSEGAGGFLCQALKNINATADPGRDPTEKLQAAAAALRQAEKHFGAVEIGGKKSRANKIAQAAEILEGSAANGKEQCQAALLLIARAMATDSMGKIDDSNSILTWDESLHLLPTTEKGEFAVNIKINDLHEPDQEPIAKADLPVLEISKERYAAKDLILADGGLVQVKADVACKGYGQLFMPASRQQFNAKVEKPEKPADERQEPHKRAFSEANEEISQETNKEIDEDLNNETIEFFEAANNPEIEKESQESPLSSSKSVFLLKVMTALLVMLLAIEAILYLI
ncbi:MAG: tetratricopeptide repeat protein [Methanothrix sp.]